MENNHNNTRSNAPKTRSGCVRTLLVLFIIFALICIALMCCSSKNNSGKDTDKKDDSVAVYMTIAQNAVDEFYNYELDFPWSGDDYKISDLGNGVQDVTVTATKKDGEKIRVRVSFTLSEDEKNISYHFVEIGGKVQLDDGTLD